MPTDTLKDIFQLILGILKDPKFGVPAGALGIGLFVVLMLRGTAEPISRIIEAFRGRQK